jgi:ubiquinone/menaquinone biosynthesis C-methylase UbiE
MTDAKNVMGWEAIAERYQRERGWPSDDLCWGHRMPLERELRLLGDVAGKRALVLGCGGGQDVIALARLGATELAGVDFSPVQLAHARSLLAAANVACELCEASVSALPMFRDARFDLVVSVHVLSYVERVDACFSEVVRLLAPGGTFAFSTQHPVDCATSDDPPYTLHKSYFQVATDEAWRSLGGDVAPFRRYHRTVADWFDALQRAGLVVDALLEPRPTSDVVWQGHQYYEKLATVPGTLIFRARKPA